MDYKELATNILKNVGGKENVNDVIHCVTRLRFHLKDESKANDTVIKNMDGVMDVIHAGGGSIKLSSDLKSTMYMML
ncbi:PTS transporter subunit EIIB [Oenococcus oeni]|nr:PTS transporter subunit EIIB [Oenococcus oeni]SYW10229.1 putative enzyme [Oenococcus oeni]